MPRTLDQLTHLILDSHPAQQILDPLLHWSTSIFVKRRGRRLPHSQRSEELHEQQPIGKQISHHVDEKSLSEPGQKPLY